MASTTIEELQGVVLSDGPKMARTFRGTTRTIVERIVYYWPMLTATPGERKWAKKQIVNDVKAIHPLVLKWLIELLVMAIIKWFFSNRSVGLSRLMLRLRHEML